MSIFEEKLELFSEMGSFLGPIVERETAVDIDRVKLCIDCLFAHAVEIIGVYRELSVEESVDLYEKIQSVVKVNKNSNGNSTSTKLSDSIQY